MSFGVSFSVRPAHHCAVRRFHRGQRAGVRLDAYRELGRCARSAPFLCLVLPFLELLCLNKCSADLVDKLEFAFLTMPVCTPPSQGASAFPRSSFGVLLGILPALLRAHRAAAGRASVAGSVENTFAFSTFAASLFACADLIMAMLTLRKSRNFASACSCALIAVLLVTLCTPIADGIFRCFACSAPTSCWKRACGSCTPTSPRATV